MLWDIHLLLYVVVFRSGLYEKVMMSAVFCTVTSVLSSICACVSTQEQGCVVGVSHPHVSFHIQLFMWAAGLPSTLQAQMAFDNG